jgi:hypothetical protein
MQIEPTISVGSILSTLASVCAIAVAFWRMAVKLSRLEFKLNMIWAWYKKEHNIDDKTDIT